MTEPASEEPSRSDTTCAAPGCPKEAHLKCSRCQTVRYCSKACQVTHWKAGHAKACRAAPGAPATPPEEDALARQDRLLRESPRADYVVEVDKTHDRAVAFERMQDRLLFRMLRGKAMECISLIGMAVGKEVFGNDAKEVMDILIRTQQGEELEPDDPQISFMLQVCMHVT